MSNTFYCNVVSGCGGHCWHVEGDTVAPATGTGGFNISEVFVVDEGAKEMALEVDVIDIDGLSPQTTKGEVDSGTESGWIRVAVSLALVHEEDA